MSHSKSVSKIENFNRQVGRINPDPHPIREWVYDIPGAPKIDRKVKAPETRTPTTKLAPVGQKSRGKKGKSRGGYAGAKKSMNLLKHIRLLRKEDDENSAVSSLSMLITDPTEIYRFKLSSEHNYSSSAGGIVNTTLNNDPSTMVEWSSLLVLFSLVRLRRSEYRVVRVVATAIPTTTSVGAFRPLVVAALADDPGSPGAYSSTIDSPNHVVYNYAFDTTAHGFKTGLSFDGEMIPDWADTSVPFSSTEFVGSPGSLQLYGESMPVSTECLFVVRSLTLEFTNRI